MLKHALLGLLYQKPYHGYGLKAAFERLLGRSWRLNIGQVYTTLSRLERDGLVGSRIVPQDLLPDRKVYSITHAGREELDRWLGRPSMGQPPLKDEFTIKTVVHQWVASGALLDLIPKQRERYTARLAELIELRTSRALEPALSLAVDGAILRVEADLLWLDLCEERLRQPPTR